MPKSSQIPIDFDNISFDVEAFDAQIASHGVEFIHYTAMRCPIGMTDKLDSRQPHHEHSNCSNGFLFQEVGKITASFTNNGLITNVDEMGLLDGSTITITLPRFYDGTDKPVTVSPFDRFYLKDVTAKVVNWQLVEANISGVDRLQFPVTEVEIIIDSRGEKYGPEDYVVDQGMIRWITQHRPPFDPKIRKGAIYSVRYKYTPFWYCKQILHEVRVSRRTNIVTGERTLVRMPQQIVLQRELLFESENHPEIEANADIRDIPAPARGSFGRR